MKDLVRGFIRWCLVILTTLTIIVWVFIFTAFCQEHPKHATQEDFEDTVGYIVVTFTSKDDRLIYWKRETSKEIKLGSFGYDKLTKMDGKLEGKLCILYCKSHNFAYIVNICRR